MRSLNWERFNAFFTTCCTLATIVTVSWCIFNYLKDEDLTVVNFMEFQREEVDIYPTVSICFTTPYEKEKLAGSGTDLVNYTDFLTGELWDEKLLTIDYDEVSLDIKDYFLGYEIMYRNATKSNLKPTFDDGAHVDGWTAPYVTYQIPNLKCFGVDVPFHKDERILQLGIKIDTRIFPNKKRPADTDLTNRNGGMMTNVHYPMQFMRGKFWNSCWPPRGANESGNYALSLDLKGMEILTERSKLAQECIAGYPNYDGQMIMNIVQSLGCRPPYVSSLKTNLSMCTTRQQFVAAQQLHMGQLGVSKLDRPQIGLSNLDFLPCRDMQKLHFSVMEMPEMGNRTTPSMTIVFQQKDVTYKEIKKVREMGIQALVGNAGGYVGLLIGYAILNIPEVLCSWYTYFKGIMCTEKKPKKQSQTWLLWQQDVKPITHTTGDSQNDDLVMLVSKHSQDMALIKKELAALKAIWNK